MLVLGLMSGTSADGIDVALARIGGSPPELKAKLVAHTTIRFPAGVREKILRVAEQQKITAGELSELNFRLGGIFGDAAKEACRRFRISRSRVGLIGSHGQTVFHRGVAGRGQVASTLQIGDISVIAARAEITTVGDFRPADMAVGGQGAPLVPYADFLLYRDAKLGRVALNLGGIANVTVLPRGCAAEQVMAFDTGPANMVIDALVAHFSRGVERFDKDGRRALAGRSIPALVNELMRDPYLKVAPPKSTGREMYGREYVKNILALGRRQGAKPNDVIRAATIFTALSVVDALNRFVMRKIKMDQLIVSGGGARNPLIMAQIAAALPEVEVVTSDDLGIATEAKEAFAFALLAYETFHGRAANVPSATGARGPAILGKIAMFQD
ncbi:MAG: anhydro-N-acetylmuramic acid kinase AnmK [Candidatus Acidiferrum sp.]